MTNEMIERLESKGFKRWTKGGYDRLYINATQLGLYCEYYKTGNICYAEFDGEKISHAEGGRLKFAKTYIDIITDTLYSNDYRLAQKAADLTGMKFDCDQRAKVIKLTV